MQNLQVQIREGQHDWLRRKAFEGEKSMASIIRDLLEREMEKEES